MEEENNPDIIEEIKRKNILHWNYRGLKNLPCELELFGDNIEELYLKDNNIIKLPTWINKLINLRNIYLSYNKLHEFPVELFHTKQLRVLDLSNNYLKLLPNNFSNLNKLTDLIIDDNCLTQLSPGLKELESLKHLSICKNNLTLLPEWIGSFKNLENLLADDNYLEELPNRLTLLSTIKTISITSNRLKYLPLNSFMSQVNIRFNSNPDLNYLSYPMLSQLLELGWDDGKDFLVENSSLEKKSTNLNIKLIVKFNELSNEKTKFIQLPRQLFGVFKNYYNEPVSLWELSLRSLYQTDYAFGFRKPDIFHNLMLNGPISVCLSNKCQQPIFTEAWIIVGKTEETTLLVVALFCSQKCVCNFDSESYGIEELSWEICTD